jgi:hypothetical protein
VAKPVVVIKDLKKECGSCTACCSGALSGQAHGHHFFKGRPCFFLKEKGCSIYEDRPDNPCVGYRCGYLVEPFFPEWMRPDKCGFIATPRVHKYVEKVKDGDAERDEERFIPYMQLVEYGSPASAKDLWWFVEKHLEGAIPNLLIEIEGGFHRIGNADFLKARL